MAVDLPSGTVTFLFTDIEDSTRLWAQEPEAMSAALAVTSLSKTFEGQRALTDVDLDVRPGEIHALVGQNGSGKSTLIKILAGFETPDPGAGATIGDEPLVDCRDATGAVVPEAGARRGSVSGTFFHAISKGPS